MDMAAKFQEHLVFHMTGKRGDGLAAVDVGLLEPEPDGLLDNNDFIASLLPIGDGLLLASRRA